MKSSILSKALPIILWMVGVLLFPALLLAQPAKTFKHPGHHVLTGVFSADSRLLATGGNDNNIVVRDVATGSVVNILSGHTNWITSLDFSNDGEYLVSGSKDNTVRIWNLANASAVQKLEHQGTVNSVDFSSNGKYVVSGSNDKTVKVWQVASGENVKTFGGHQKEVLSVQFSPDDKSIVSGSADNTWKEWNMAGGNILHSVTAHKGWIRAVRYSPDGKYIATGSDDKTVKIWEAGKGTLLKTLEGHRNWIQTLQFSPDSKYLVSGGHDYAVKIWETVGGIEVSQALLKKHKDIVTMTAFSPNGKMLATAEAGEDVKLWDVSPLAIIPAVPQKPKGDEKQVTLANSTGNKSTSAANDLDFDPGAEPVNYMLVIAINKYKHWSQLGNAVKDAEDVKATLTKLYTFETENVFEVYNEAATADGILEAFAQVRKKLTAKDNLLIYFSGHGYNNEEVNRGYWIPVDAQRGKESQYLPNSVVLDEIKALKSKHVFLIADACFSGSIFGESTRGYVENVEQVPSRWALTSGGLEKVSDGSVGKNSPFAAELIEFLKNNKDKKIPVSVLVTRIKMAVANNADQQPIGNPLKNVGDKGGEFIFYLREQ